MVRYDISVVDAKGDNWRGHAHFCLSRPRCKCFRFPLEAPLCDGSEPLRWLYKVEEYFKFYKTSVEDRLRCIALMLEGPAADWFRWRMNGRLITNYADFVEKFKLRFDPQHYVDYFGQLANLRQTGTVMDYQTAFEHILTHVTGASEGNLMSLFHAGLKPYLQHEIALLRPPSLSASFALARELEAKHDTLLRAVSTRPSSWSSSTPSRFPAPVKGPPPLDDNPPAKPLRPEIVGSTPVRRLPWAERRAKGLCYNCDQKWSKTHRCHRFLLLCDDDDEELPLAPTDEAHPIAADISCMNAMDGVATPRSLRLTGRVSNSDVHVLIDRGNTHNFVHPNFISRLQIPVFMVTPFRVYVGNGDSLPWDKQCLGLTLRLQGTSFPVDVFVLPIHGQDIVLGVQCLQKLGRVTHDYASMKMEFLWENNRVLLKGDTSPLQALTLHALHSLRAARGITDCYELYCLAPTDAIRQANHTEPDLAELHRAHVAGRLPLPYAVEDGLLFYKRRLCIGSQSPLRTELLREYHDTLMAGHGGVLRTFQRLAMVFFWKGLRMSPFQALYGRPPPSFLPYKPGDRKVPAVDEMLSERAALFESLRQNLTTAQQRMKTAADQHRRELSFDVGDLVLLRLQPHRKHSVARRCSAKLSRRHYGTFEVEAKIGPVAYRLQLPQQPGCTRIFMYHSYDLFMGHVTLPAFRCLRSSWEASPYPVSLKCINGIPFCSMDAWLNRPWFNGRMEIWMMQRGNQ
ncbi:unnamed protein product [Cuscuta campestris]|uniref:Retrotransposon gag domain-containing protein n=1 Tax=Cuscuta campestris TaxID=132261 RepID=A0A484MVE9_9ASTE|nr:unnamed protein product [Cuscuta campestris]